MWWLLWPLNGPGNYYSAGLTIWHPRRRFPASTRGPVLLPLHRRQAAAVLAVVGVGLVIVISYLRSRRPVDPAPDGAVEAVPRAMPVAGAGANPRSRVHAAYDHPHNTVMWVIGDDTGSNDAGGDQLPDTIGGACLRVLHRKGVGVGEKQWAAALDFASEPDGQLPLTAIPDRASALQVLDNCSQPFISRILVEWMDAEFPAE